MDLEYKLVRRCDGQNLENTHMYAYFDIFKFTNYGFFSQNESKFPETQAWVVY